MWMITVALDRRVEQNWDLTVPPTPFSNQYWQTHEKQTKSWFSRQLEKRTTKKIFWVSPQKKENIKFSKINPVTLWRGCCQLGQQICQHNRAYLIAIFWLAGWTQSVTLGKKPMSVACVRDFIFESLSVTFARADGRWWTLWVFFQSCGFDRSSRSLAVKFCDANFFKLARMTWIFAIWP